MNEQNQNKEISLESIFKEGQLHLKIAELSQIVLQMSQELNDLKKQNNPN